MGSSLRHDPSRLEHRRQFRLSRGDHSLIPSSISRSIGDGWILESHIDLAVTHRSERDHHLTLIGELFDPRSPVESNDEIADRLLSDVVLASDPDALLNELSHLAGRWVVVCLTPSAEILATDAAGTRQVFHSADESGNRSSLQAASDPGLIASALDLQITEAFRAVVASADYAANPQFWWPGTRTPFEDIRLLLPNHVLDLRTGRVRRYWPSAPREVKGMAEAVVRCSSMMANAVKAASHRFTLTLSLSAGIDSRVLLAASRDFAKDILVHTWITDDMDEEHPDVVIPKRLAERVGLNHQIIELSQSCSPEFHDVYARSVTAPHDQWAGWAEDLYREIPDGTLNLRGNVAEIAKCNYKPRVRGRRINSGVLGRISELGTSPFVTQAFDDWLAELNGLNGYDLLDLFHWEQRSGSWWGSSNREWDIVQDTFSPYNSRALLLEMLSVEAKYRRPPESELQRAMVMQMWPELLEEPIYPAEEQRLLGRGRRRVSRFRDRGLVSGIGEWREDRNDLPRRARF